PEADATLRQAARLSSRLRCGLTVVHVTGAGTEAGRYRDRVAELRAIARELDAEWVDLRADDEARAVVRFAQDHQAAQIVVGAQRHSRWPRLVAGSTNDKIISVAAGAGLDVHVLGLPREQ